MYLYIYVIVYIIYNMHVECYVLKKKNIIGLYTFYS